MCFWKKHWTNVGYPLQYLPPRSIQITFCKHRCSGMIDTLVQAQLMILWGLLDTLIRFLPIGWVWIDRIVYGWFLKIDILKECVFVLSPRSIVSKQTYFWNFENWVGGIRMPRIAPSRGVSMDAAREVKLDLRRNYLYQRKRSAKYILPYITPDQPPWRPDIIRPLHHCLDVTVLSLCPIVCFVKCAKCAALAT